MKKLALFISLTMIMVLAACGNSEGQPDKQALSASNAVTDTQEKTEEASDTVNDTESGTDSVEWEEDPAEVNWYLWNVGGSTTPDGIKMVEDALNEITLDKINVKVHLNMLEIGTYMTQMPMDITAGSKVDLISTFPAGSGLFSTMATTGQLMPLDELESLLYGCTA